MAQYNFEGDTDNISERQLEFINSVIVKLGYESSKILFEPVGLAGDNYVASVKRITINGPHGTFKIIAKIAPTFETLRLAMNTAMMFKNEHIMYTEVLPRLVQLQKNAEIPTEEQLRYAKCYGSLTEQPNEVILLEDLKVSGFTMLDRFKPLSSDCVKSVLKNFAILHSLSFALKHNDEETYNSFKNNLEDLWSNLEKIEDMKLYFQALETDAIAIIDDENYNNILRGKCSNAIDRALECSKNDATTKYGVIQQGDSWTNNIMFRFEDEKPIDSIMIDYQIAKHSSPAGDLLYMIFNCTDHETRKEKFHDWIDFYYSELDKSLSNFSLKANIVYPRNILDADLKLYSKFMFGLAILLASILIRKTDDAAKMKDAMKSDNLMEQQQELLVSTLDEESKTLFRNRIIGLIESFTKFELF